MNTLKNAKQLRPGDNVDVRPHVYHSSIVLTTSYICYIIYFCNTVERKMLPSDFPYGGRVTVHVYSFCSEVQSIVLSNIATISTERPVSYFL